MRNLAQRVGAGRAVTIAPVAELATKAPRGYARGTLGPGPGGPSDDLVGSTPYQDCSWNLLG